MTVPTNSTSTDAPNARVDIYKEHHEAFQAAGQSKTEQEWLARAAEVSRLFAIDASQRDIDNVSPVAEVGLLKSSGLLKILGPKQYGGGGQGWDVGYKAIREVAKGDGYDSNDTLCMCSR